MFPMKNVTQKGLTQLALNLKINGIHKIFLLQALTSSKLFIKESLVVVGLCSFLLIKCEQNPDNIVSGDW